MQPEVFERDEHIYIVAPLTPIGPSEETIEEFAFHTELTKIAPNDNLMWLQGNYVEADRANLNRQMWTAGELRMKQLTPRLMPVTVMHDPRTAVGLIADARLRTPDGDGVARSRIETTLAIWKHRFGEIAEEVMENYQAGTLMQSMECVAPHYSCEECSEVFPRLPGGAEEAMWCAHLKGEGQNRAARILGNVVFTGTGLIFGTRGSQGAYKEAHLEVSQDEIAEFHAEAAHQSKTSSTRKRPSRSKPQIMDIEQSKYDELMSRPTADALQAEVAKRETAEEAAAEAERKLEAAEIEKQKAVDEKAEADRKLNEATEQANAAKLSEERMGKLGAGFTQKLPESVKTKLTEQAKSMKDEEWSERLTELSEMVGVEHDAAGEEGGEGGTGDEFSNEEIASAGVGRQPSASKEPSSQERGSVVGKLAGLGAK